MRGYEAEAHVGVGEVHAIARGADVPVHISHFHGPANMLVQLVDDSRASGVDLTFDSYPYSRGSSIVAMVGLPAWVQAGGTDATVARLRDADVRKRLRETWFAGRPDLFARITFAWVANPASRLVRGTDPAGGGRDRGFRPCRLSLRPAHSV